MTEGSFPKVDGDIFYASEANMLTNEGTLLKNYAQLLFNADYIGFNAGLGGNGSPQFKNLFYDTGLSSTRIGGESLYDFSGGTIGTTYWTTSLTGAHAVASKTGGIISVYCGGSTTEDASETAILSSNGSSGNYITGNSVFLFSYTWNYTNNSNATTGSCRLSITDGSATVDIDVHSTGTPGHDDSGTVIARVNVDKTSKTCTFTQTLSDTTDNAIDLAALGAGNWYFKFSTGGVCRDNATADRSSAGIGLYKFAKLSSSAVVYTEIVGTADATATNLIPVINKSTTGTCTATFEVSADSGSHWLACTDATLTNLTYTGTGLQLRVTLTDDGTNIPYFSEWAVMYNVR